MTIKAKFSGLQGSFNIDVDFEFPDHGVTALFGPSGSGKTTILRCMAGLVRLPKGDFGVDGEVWQSANQFLKTYQRDIGYVFQEASLFPHKSVRDNLYYGAKRCQVNKEALVNFNEMVQLLGIEHLLARSPARLSGGERQRVAIGRALMTQPKILLMDEPLSALDHETKQDILPYLENLHKLLRIPIVYVTHAIDEVARLADYMVLLEQGKVKAQGELADMLARTDLPFRHDENAAMILDATIVERDQQWHLAKAVFAGGSLWVRDHGLTVNQSVRLRVLARDVSIGLAPSENVSIQNILSAQVNEVVANKDPAVMLIKLQLDSTQLLARLTARSAHQLGLTKGQLVWAHIKSAAVLE